MAETGDRQRMIETTRHPGQGAAGVWAAIDALRGAAERAAPRRRGGLACFDYLYREITRAVRQQVDRDELLDAAFIARVDLEFATRYFDAVFADESGTALPDVWRVLLVRRPALDVDTPRFSAVRMSLSVSPDLAAALRTMSRALGRPFAETEYVEYQAINQVFSDHVGQLREHFESRLSQPLGTGVFAIVANAVGDLAVVFAPDADWHRARRLATLVDPSPELDRARVAIDWQAAMVDRAALDRPAG
ncbi:MAG TPA: DUF5995 family protein [Pseudonocardia sp.]|nr:DUF5995 family protein [Pseudonocardia sp.]